MRDIIKALITAGESPLVGKGEVINIGTGHGTSVNELADAFGGPIEYLLPRVEPKTSRADVMLAEKLLSFKASVSLTDGIAELKREWGII